MRDKLSARDAYRAMFLFLETYYDRSGSGELGDPLSGMAINEDGQPMDPAAWGDWLAADSAVIESPDPGR